MRLSLQRHPRWTLGLSLLSILPMVALGYWATRHVQRADELGRVQAEASSAYAGELARGVVDEELYAYFRPRREKLLLAHAEGEEAFERTLRALYFGSNLLEMPQFLTEAEVRAWPRPGGRASHHLAAHESPDPAALPWEQALVNTLQDYMADAGQRLLRYDAESGKYRAKALLDEDGEASFASQLGWMRVDISGPGGKACPVCLEQLVRFGARDGEAHVALLAVAFPLPGRADLEAGMFGALVPAPALLQSLLQPALMRWVQLVQPGGGMPRHGVRLVDGEGTRLAPQLPPWPDAGDVPVLWSSGFLDESAPWRLEAFPVEEAAVAQLMAQGQRWSLFFALATLLLVVGAIFLASGVTRQVENARLQSHLLGNMGHELKTPLSLIRLYSETLESGRVAGAEQAAKFQGIIGREAKRLSHLIDNLLDIQRIEQDRKQYSFAQVRPGKIVRETVEAYRFQLAEAGFDLRLDVDDDLPLVMLDEEAVAQALINLLDNAVKYSDTRKEIRVRCRVRDGDELVISVRDKGIGIPRGEQRKIFDRFYRVEKGLVHNVKGSGLGLAVVEHVAKAHGGVVEVDSKPGAGSCFRLVLPLGFEPGGED